MNALTRKTWIATLERMKRSAIDDDTRTLVQMLLEITHDSRCPVVAGVLDTYGLRMLERTA